MKICSRILGAAALLVTVAAACPVHALPYIPNEDWWPTRWNEAWDQSATEWRTDVGSISTGYLYQRSDLRMLKDFDGEVRFQGWWTWQSDNTDRAQPDGMQSRSLYGTYALTLHAAGPFWVGLALQHSYYKLNERSGPVFRFEWDKDRMIEWTTVLGSNVKWIELVENDSDRNDPRYFHVVTYLYYPALSELHARWRFNDALFAELTDDAFVESYRVESIVPLMNDTQFDERWNRAKLLVTWKASPDTRLRATAEHEYFRWAPAQWWPVDWPVAPDRGAEGPFYGDLRLLIDPSGSAWNAEARVYGGFRQPDPIDLEPIYRNETGVAAWFETPLFEGWRYGVEGILDAPSRGFKVTTGQAEGALRLHLEWHPRPETRLLGRAEFLATPQGSYHLFSLAAQTSF